MQYDKIIKDYRPQRTKVKKIVLVSAKLKKSNNTIENGMRILNLNKASEMFHTKKQDKTVRILKYTSKDTNIFNKSIHWKDSEKFIANTVCSKEMAPTIKRSKIQPKKNLSGNNKLCYSNSTSFGVKSSVINKSTCVNNSFRVFRTLPCSISPNEQVTYHFCTNGKLCKLLTVEDSARVIRFQT